MKKILFFCKTLFCTRVPETSACNFTKPSSFIVVKGHVLIYRRSKWQKRLINKRESTKIEPVKLTKQLTEKPHRFDHQESPRLEGEEEGRLTRASFFDCFGPHKSIERRPNFGRTWHRPDWPCSPLAGLNVG